MNHSNVSLDVSIAKGPNLSGELISYKLSNSNIVVSILRYLT